MKFLTKINRTNFILLSTILIVISIAGYFLLKAIIISESKENLVNKEYLVVQQIRETGNLPDLYPLIEVYPVSKSTLPEPTYTTIYIKNELEDEYEPFLEYANELNINGKLYIIKLRQSTLEDEDLILILGVSLFILMLTALGISMLTTRKLNKTVWKDFETNLELIENYNFTKNTTLPLVDSNIEEFDRLNRVIKKLTQKLKHDYTLMKEFTENASHEIQTPLSVMLLNLEELLQQDLSEESFHLVASTIRSVKQLSSLNRNLILLTKIENNQFSGQHSIVLNAIIRKTMEEYTPLIESKNIQVSLTEVSDFVTPIHEQLAEILIGNLISNAINHNQPDGTIDIQISSEEISICNTGTSNNLTDKNIFDRFTKGNSKSYGLGLALVKNICETHQLSIQYHAGERHCFKIQHL